MTTQTYFLLLIIVILSALAIANAVQPTVKLQRRIHRSAYRRGLVHGRRRAEREYRHAKRVELHDAQRLADERPDAGQSARVAPIQFRRRHDI